MLTVVIPIVLYCFERLAPNIRQSNTHIVIDFQSVYCNIVLITSSEENSDSSRYVVRTK